MQTLKLGIFADLHLAFNPRDCDCQKGEVLVPLERLEYFLARMREQEAEAVLNLGDFCIDFDLPQGRESLELWNDWSGAKISVVGNHDFQHQSKMEYAEALSAPGSYYAQVAGGIRFCILDSASRTEPYSSGADCPSDEQLAWLEKELLDSREKCIIALHGGFYPKIQRLIDKVHQTLGTKRVVAYFYGHHHVPAACRIHGVWYIGINSISYRWVPEGEDRTYWYKEPLYSLLTIDPETGTFELTGNGSAHNWATEFCDYEDPLEPDTLSYQITLPNSASISQ